MNIFAFDTDPHLSALWLDDVRKNKMILETAQLLSTAIRLNSTVTDPVYKMAYINHPCTRWTSKSRGNFKWLLSYWKHLLDMKSTSHKSSSLLPYFEKYVVNGDFPLEDQTPFTNCARNISRGVDFHAVSDVHQAYRLYINKRWGMDTITLSWRWGSKPEWKDV